MSSSDLSPPPPEAGFPPVVVVGLDSLTGLQSARILAARSVEVHGVVADRRHWGARTNAVASVVESPLSGAELVDSLVELGQRLRRRAVLLACTDPAVHTVSRHRDRLQESFAISLPAHAVVDLLMDKVRFARYAAEHGFPVPRTELLSDRAQAEAVAAEISYPCVLKPPGKTPAWLARTAAKGFRVSDPAMLLETYDRVGPWAPLLLAQEWIPGPETELYSCNAVFDRDGRPLTTFVARKVRQWPPGVGTSASGEECRNDEVLETTLQLFGGLHHRGLAYLEMKRDARTGTMMVVEPNVGRPTGRSAIAEQGGVELLFTAFCEAADLPLPTGRPQAYGDARWLDLRRDAQAALVARREGALTIRDWLRWIRGPKAHAIWSREDPAPFLSDLLRATRTGISRWRSSASSGRLGRTQTQTSGERVTP